MKITHPITRAAFGVTALVAVVILANWLVSLSPLGSRGADFTEKHIHTLSDGTCSILAELDSPVSIRYYASRNTDFMPQELKLHMRRVDDLLKEYVSLSKGKVRVDNLDPAPDTDAEDSANLDGINGQRFDDQNLYFGMAISCLDKTSTIPFLDPRDETMLEYRLSKAIAEVSNPVKPKIGVMSAFELKGSPATMPNQRPNPGWILYQQLKQSFDVVDISMEAATIDPKVIKALLVLHPAGITPETEFSIDQYLLNGGTVIACLDSFSVTAHNLSNGNRNMGQQGIPTSSTLPTLLPAWGVTFESSKTLADTTFATKVGTREAQEPVTALAVLTLDKKGMPQKDNVLTKDLENVSFFLPGGFTITGGGGVTANSLVKSSTNTEFVDSFRAMQLDPSLATSFHSSDTAYNLVTHLTGKFKTAFPNGKPKAKGEAADDKKDDGKDAKKDEAKPESLKEAVNSGNVFLIADVDAFYDIFAFNVQNFGGMQMVSPKNGNVTLLLNILDQAVGIQISDRIAFAFRRPPPVHSGPKYGSRI